MINRQDNSTGKGYIYVYFKGMPMHPIPAVELTRYGERLVVEISAGLKQTRIFKKVNNSWMLENSLSIHAPLHGTYYA